MPRAHRNQLFLAILALVAVLAPVGCGTRAASPETARPRPEGVGLSMPVAPASPSTGRSRRRCPPPVPGRRLAAAQVPARFYQAGWAGTEMLVHQPNHRTDRDSIGAACNPLTNTWRRLPTSHPYRVKSNEVGT